MTSDEQLLFYANGALYAKLRFSQGKREGRHEFFYESGFIKTLQHYVEGRLHGEVLLFWPNGQMKRQCAFCRGVREGVDRMWSAEGILLDEENYASV